jgi:hypothetical protein
LRIPMPSACRTIPRKGRSVGIRWECPAGVVPLLVVHTHREEGGEEYIRDHLGAKGDAVGKEDL